MLKRFIKEIGGIAVSFINSLGNLTIMSFKALIAVRKSHTYIDQIIESFVYIGKDSLALLVTTSLFMGLVIGVHIGSQTLNLTPPWVEGGIILKLVLLEMGPIISGLVLAGRVGAGISSEIGEMNVTEQIDALRSTAIDPIEYIVMPRVLAGMFAIPILIIWGDLISILFGFISTSLSIGLTWSGFVKGMESVFEPTDVYTSIIKGFIFGIIITLFGCYFGLQAKQGAKGVGKATTYAVVWSSIVIIIMDFIISVSLLLIW